MEKPAGPRRKFVIRRPWNPASGISRGRERRLLKRISLEFVADVRNLENAARRPNGSERILVSCTLACQNGRRRRKREREGPRRLHPPICLRGKGKGEGRPAREFHPRAVTCNGSDILRCYAIAESPRRMSRTPCLSLSPSLHLVSHSAVVDHHYLGTAFDSSRVRSSVSRFYAPKATRDSSTVAPGRCSWLRTYANSTPRWHRPSANLSPDATWPARSRSARCSGY